MTLDRTDGIWRESEVARRYLDDVAVGAIPLENEHLAIMCRLIMYERPEVRRFMDIGCGNGILSAVILEKYPDSSGVLVDFSETMLKAAKEKLRSNEKNLTFAMIDYGDEKWLKDLSVLCGKTSDFDVVVSRLSIHHQLDARKIEIYKEIFDILAPGGIFVNIEHVAPASESGSKLFADYIVDHLYDSQVKKDTGKNRDQIARDFHERHQKDADIVAPVEKQCEWLREIGFNDVDCYFKVFDIAVFAGRK
ncbi:MAG: class I SAM-dependent methyltransferase [Candidatus Omnitrophota bacterium]